jgi:hypothetical protein
MTATLCQMNTRLGAIEVRLTSLEARLRYCTLGLGGFLAALMTVYKFL